MTALTTWRDRMEREAPGTVEIVSVYRLGRGTVDAHGGRGTYRVTNYVDDVLRDLCWAVRDADGAILTSGDERDLDGGWAFFLAMEGAA